jgi:GT2 family glycosyltransferase
MRHAPGNTEVIVVDDGSSRGSVAAIAAAHSPVRVVRLERSRGFCAAANAGIAAARGRIIELLNDDTEVTAHWATAALATFADPEVGAATPLVLFPPSVSSTGALIDSAGDRYYVGGVAGKRGHGLRLETASLSRCRVFGASGSSAFYRREALLRVGAFAEAFAAYFEDVDLSFRLHRGGYHIVFEPASLVYHRGGSSYGPPRRQLLEQQSRNEERVFWRNLPAPVLQRSLGKHAAVLVAKAWRRWNEGTLAPFLCGRLRLLGEVPALRRQRLQLQALSVSSDMTKWEVDMGYWGNRRKPKR